MKCQLVIATIQNGKVQKIERHNSVHTASREVWISRYPEMKFTTGIASDVRGNCGHRHRTVGAAQRCLARDQRACKRQGGYSDRYVREVIEHEGGGWHAGPIVVDLEN